MIPNTDVTIVQIKQNENGTFTDLSSTVVSAFWEEKEVELTARYRNAFDYSGRITAKCLLLEDVETSPITQFHIIKDGQRYMIVDRSPIPLIFEYITLLVGEKVNVDV